MASGGNTEQASFAQYSFRAADLSTQDLHVVSIDGHEGLSQLYHYRLTLSSRNRNILHEEMVGQMAVLRVAMNPMDDTTGHPDDPTAARYVSGIISRFEHVMDGSSFSQYEAEIVPFFWLLNFRHGNRIFQDMGVKKIIEMVLKDAGVPAEMIDWRLTGDHESRDYCVQHRETEWNFVERLCEDEGIFYFFEHTEESHRIVFGDSNEAFLPIFGEPKLLYRPTSGMVFTEHVFHFRHGEEIRTGKATHRDFDFKTPGTPTEAKHEYDLRPELEYYDYPADFISGDAVQPSKPDKRVLARIQSLSARRIIARGQAICRRFITGYKFVLDEFPRTTTNGEYLLTHMTVTGRQPESTEEGGQGDATDPRQNHLIKFQAIPAAVPYRPPRVAHRPTVQGSQTAIVVGPSDEEIYTDEYGRVKVKFHWDREGEFKETDSCWIRVSQGWAGGNYGIMFLPRIGQEVIVDFLEGDPDRPIITGRVYNADHMPPYALPDNKTISTILTSSSKDGGGANELRFEDKKGSEQVFIHGQKNIHIRSLRDTVVSIGSETDDGPVGDYHTTVEKEMREWVKDNRSRKVDKDEAIAVDGSRSITVGGDVEEKTGGDQKKEIGGSYSDKVGADFIIEAGSAVSLKGPGGFVLIDGGGVTIQGTMVKINSGGSALTAPAPQPASPAEPIEADRVTPGQDTDYTGQKETPIPIPLPVLPPLLWIRLEMKTQDDEPCPGIGYVLTPKSGGDPITGTLDVNGEAFIAGLSPDEYEVTYPELDDDEYEKKS